VSEYAFRAPVAGDVEQMVAVTVTGFESYRAFAPEGWEPPSTADEIERLEGLLGQDHVWYLVAEHEGELVGHVGFLAADRLSFARVDDPRLAHFRQLFVMPAHWGTGLARRLHAAAIDEAGARGFTPLRLFTPAGQVRARRFYEREGWETDGVATFEEGLELELLVYTRGGLT
jgi:GNAT superfamily N-acetyltransferase